MERYQQFSDLEADAQQTEILLQIVEEDSYKITLGKIQDFNQAMMEESPEIEMEEKSTPR